MDLAAFDREIWLNYYDNKSDSPRKYIGASSIGHLCDRKIWLDWKGIVNPKDFMNFTQYGRKQEIYERGHLEEEVFIKKLTQAGFEVIDRQLSFEDPLYQMKGHCDGIIKDKDGIKYLLEIKTMKENAFRAVSKHGLKKQYPQYVTQVQIYMHYFKLSQSIVFCLNKNVDFERYIERVYYDSFEVEAALAKAKRILSFEDQIPAVIGAFNKPTHYICHMCDYYNFCYKSDEVLTDTFTIENNKCDPWDPQCFMK